MSTSDSRVATMLKARLSNGDGDAEQTTEQRCSKMFKLSRLCVVLEECFEFALPDLIVDAPLEN